MMHHGLAGSASGLTSLVLAASAAAGGAAATDRSPTEPPPNEVSLAPDPIVTAPAADEASLFTRAQLSGDWGGRRTSLAAAGLKLEIGWTQIAQGVVAGGRRQDWDYGGNLDLLLDADLDSMGLVPGGSLTLHGESRYGKTVNDDAGAFTPVNTRGYFPFASTINEGIPFTITELSYTQSLGESLDFTIGKMLTADGDPTEFAGGSGRTQFFNSNFIYNVATSQTAPYSTLGASLDWSPSPSVTVSAAIFNTTDSSTTSGFEHLDDGWTWWSQLATCYRLDSLPGGMNVGGQYGFDNQFAKLGGKLTLLPSGPAIETVSDSWAVFWGAWQYLHVSEAPPDEIDASDLRADIRGIGLFARFGAADPDANPVRWSLSAGLGGRGLIPGRSDDTCGLGYYTTEIHTSPRSSRLGLPSTTRGFEAFYNAAIARAMELTFDIQWIDEDLARTDPAVVVGVRLGIEF